MKTKGITLISLVVTIVILLILAGVSLNLILGQNGVIGKSKEAKDKSIISGEKETISLALAACKTGNNFNNVDKQSMEDELNNEGTDIQVNMYGTDLLIKFNSTNHEYVIKQDGNILSKEDFNNSRKIVNAGYTSDFKYVKMADDSIRKVAMSNAGDWNTIDIDKTELFLNNIKQINSLTALSNDGKVYTWGFDYNGNLGDGINTNVDSPVCLSEIPNNALYGKNIKYVDNNRSDIFYAIDDAGKLYTWGDRNYNGELGNGTTEATYKPICISDIEVSPLKNSKIKFIKNYSADSLTFALDEDGKVYTWGRNYEGALGCGRVGDDNNSSMPICLNDIEGNALHGKIITSIQKSDLYIAAIDNNGKLYTWASNLYGSLGNGTDKDSNVPICINDVAGSPLNNKKVIDISLDGYRPSFAIDSDGKIYGWGNNEYGQLGDGTTNNSNLPICKSDIEGNCLNGVKIIKFYGDSYGISNDGKFYEVRGKNPSCLNDIGNGLLKDKKINDIYYGNNSFYFLCDDNKIYNYSYFGEHTLTCLTDDNNSPLYNKNIVAISSGIFITDDGNAMYYYQYCD